MVSKIQSIIFLKHLWTKPNAVNWLKNHNFKSDVDEKLKTWRFRQIQPNKKYKYITKKTPEGISFVIQI